jgi:RNA-directed DNA polymerase
MQESGYVTNKRQEQRPTTVPFAATPVGALPIIKTWANFGVWTERMLATLETGVKGGRWHTLIDKVYSRSNLFDAARRVTGNRGAPGVDHVNVDLFESRLGEELDKLEELLRTDTYGPQAILRTWIPKPGSTEKRPLGIPTVRDRVVQTALLHVIEPIFDHTFHEHSYGFRHGRGCPHALREVERLLQEGYVYVVDADLKSYFDTIPHETLMDRIREKVSDSRVLRLIETFLRQGILEDLSTWTPEEGTPQGAVISPLLANIYLNPLDQLVGEAGFPMVRYADDFVILCRTAEEAAQVLDQVRAWVDANGLTLHPTKTKIVNARTEGFEFLGYRFKAEIRSPRKKSLAKIKETIRVKTRRNNGDSLPCLMAQLKPTLRGWFTYFRHCHPNVFRDLDSYIRGRLRSILRKRCRRRGRARGKDHQRWPNSFFRAHGFFSLKDAHAAFCQSCPRSNH